MFPQLCGGGRPHCTFACQGSPVEGWESGRVRRGEAIVSVLNRKLHNICSLALREGVDSQLCVFRNVFWIKQNLHPDRRCDIQPPHPPKKISEWLPSVTETFHFLWLDFLTCGWGGSNLGFIVAVGQKWQWHCEMSKVLNSADILRQTASNCLRYCDRF